MLAPTLSASYDAACWSVAAPNDQSPKARRDVLELRQVVASRRRDVPLRDDRLRKANHPANVTHASTAEREPPFAFRLWRRCGTLTQAGDAVVLVAGPPESR